MRRKSITLLLIGSMILSLAGCSVGSGKAEPVKATQEIELIEPVNAEVSYEEAAIRNMYAASVYAATVVPYVQEYGAEYAFTFGSYGAYLGETVKKGQQLISSNTESIDEQIKTKKELIASMQDEYQKYMEKQQKNVDEYRRQEANAKWAYEQYEKIEEPEKIPAEDGSDEMVENPEYAGWRAMYDRFMGDYRIAKHAADTLELNMQQRTELYELDLTHQKYLLKTLQQNRQNAMITSGMDGEIVALTDLGSNRWLQADVPVVAVGDLNKKILKCDYINKNTIKNAQEVYALVDGVKYQVEYEAMSSDEYARQSANGGKVYSTFYLPEGTGEEIQVGDYAVIAVISKRYENVLSIPKGSIRKDELGSFVYLYQDGKSVRANIQTGYSDGTYTEIVSGLKEGDKVLFSAAQKLDGSKTVKLGRGEFHTDFSERAELTYSNSEELKNPVENGTTYFGEYQVKLFQHVDKGDVIATVRVEADNIALSRNETRLTRLQERLADYKKEHAKETEEEYYIETVKSYDEQIADVQETIAKQKKDFATKQIVAQKTGVILRMDDSFVKESIVQKNATIAVIADESSCYVQVEDTNQMLQYGNLVTVEYQDAEQRAQKVTCKVVTMSKVGVGRELQTDMKKILLPEESVESVLQGALAGDWWNRYRYTVSAKVRTMDNVLIVPRTAVFDNGGKTYVYVKDENGTIKAQFFVSGGYNDSYYWVVEGLTEGMEICSK